MRIEIETKIKITPTDGDGIVVYEETIVSKSTDISTAINMINVGKEKMNDESNRALLLEIDKINNKEN